jgi:phosphopantothenoylcysteine decarboxylase/phosphopantothenate--cysteine ligase
MAGGHADDLASTVLMATDKAVLAAPAMNPRMWLNPATQRNVALLKADGIGFVGPNTGEMAEAGEAGPGRLAEVPEIIAAAKALLAARPAPRERAVTKLRLPLEGRHVLVTSGPTHEPIDPVRYIANRSSGKQGHALAAAAARLGARVTLITGPVALPDPPGAAVVRVETAQAMLHAVEQNLPADVAIFAAAVADWRPASAPRDKIKRTGEKRALDLVENPDILATVGKSRTQRPALVIGFAAETADVVAHAGKKRKTKGADWIVANDVSPETGVLGGDSNTVHLVTVGDVEDWAPMSKEEVAERILLRAAEHLRRNTAAAE